MVKARKEMALAKDKAGDIVLRGLWQGAITSHWKIVAIEPDEDGFRVATLVPVKAVSVPFECDGQVFYTTEYRMEG